MTGQPTSVPSCPACGFSSIYTDGHGPCSVSCALKLTQNVYSSCSVSLDKALALVHKEALARGLPYQPHFRDIKEEQYRYILVSAKKTSTYWRLDRDILSCGLNVEYTWVTLPLGRGRLYRVAPSLLSCLPESMQDYKLKNMSLHQLVSMARLDMYWHFLPAK